MSKIYSGDKLIFNGDYFENDFLYSIEDGLIMQAQSLESKVENISVPEDDTLNVKSDLEKLKSDIEKLKNNSRKFDDYIQEIMENMNKAERNNKDISDELKLCYLDYLVGSYDNNSVMSFSEFSEQPGFEFYDKYIKGNVDKNQSNSEIFSQVTALVMKQVSKAIKNGDMKYSDSIGIYVPNGVYRKNDDGSYGMGDYIDCSSFVEMCLYEYAVESGNTKMMDDLKTYRYRYNGESNENDKNVQLVASQLMDMSDEDQKTFGVKKFDYVQDFELKKGDILVSGSHTEIYAGDGKVWSCGSDESAKAELTDKGIQPGNTVVLRYE